MWNSWDFDRRYAATAVSSVMHHAETLDPEVAAEAKTDLGLLWVEKHGQVLTTSLMEHGYWDPTISGLIKRALTKGSTFVDVGANIGYFSVLASRLVGPEGRVFAVEPDAVNLTILRANLWRQRCSNVTVLPVAAWHEPTHLNIMRPEEEGAVAQVGGEQGGGRLIPAAPLDDLIPGPVDYIKIDTELTDHIAVRGAQRILRENPSLLITVEFHPWEETHTGDSPSDVLEIYKGLGLNAYEISPSGDSLSPTTYERVAAPTLPEDHNCFDFALSRNLPAPLLRQKAFLEKAGDMLDHVPEPVRPKIRHRDRRPTVE